MSKTNELVERYVLDEYKRQFDEANSKPELAVYGVVLGYLILYLPVTVRSVRDVSHGLDLIIALMWILVFIPSLMLGWMFLFRLSTRLPRKKLDQFKPEAEAQRLKVEARNSLLRGQTFHALPDEADDLVSEVVRVEMVERFIEITEQYRKYNLNRRNERRWLSIFFFAAGFVSVARAFLPKSHALCNFRMTSSCS